MKSCLFRLALVLGMCALTALAQEEKPQGAPNLSQQLSEAAVVRIPGNLPSAKTR